MDYFTLKLRNRDWLLEIFFIEQVFVYWYWISICVKLLSRYDIITFCITSVLLVKFLGGREDILYKHSN